MDPGAPEKEGKSPSHGEQLWVLSQGDRVVTLACAAG